MHEKQIMQIIATGSTVFKYWWDVSKAYLHCFCVLHTCVVLFSTGKVTISCARIKRVVHDAGPGEVMHYPSMDFCRNKRKWLASWWFLEIWGDTKATS